MPAPAGAAPDAPSGDFSIGMAVFLVNRVTLKFPLDSDPDFRRDLRVGIHGKVLELHADGK